MKKLWILNHYGRSMYFNENGRHYNIAKYLKEKNNYDVTVFVANKSKTTTNSQKIRKSEIKQLITTENNKFILIRTIKETNFVTRIFNWILFYLNVIRVMKTKIRSGDIPNCIIASSVHPLTILAGLKISKKYKIPIIAEIRDLWPESIVAYTKMRKDTLLMKLLYKGENYLYKNSDKVVFTWEGGKQYILDKGWESSISLDKIHHINNGVALKSYNRNLETYKYESQRNIGNKLSFVYTGSIGKVNNLEFLLKVTNLLKDKYEDDFDLLVFGKGNELEKIKDYAKNNGLKNIHFMGYVEKKFIPSILSQASVNILHNKSTILDKYGQSQNKLFEYLASGKPILQTYKTNYSIIENFNAGICAETQTPENVAKIIKDFIEGKYDTNAMGKNALLAAQVYDYEELSSQYNKIIKELINEIIPKID